MASVCKCFNWTPEYVMHGISYAALMLVVEGLPESKSDGKKGKGKPKLSTDITSVLAQARMAKQD